MADETITYEIMLKEVGWEHRNDEAKVRYLTIPKAWEVTFGPVCPGDKTVIMAVRCYDGKALRAVIPNAESLLTEGVVLKAQKGNVVDIEVPKANNKKKDNCSYNAGT